MSQSIAISAGAATSAQPARRLTYWAGGRRRLRHGPTTVICCVILLVLLLAAIFAPLVAPHDPFRTSMIRRLLPPGSPNFLLGTDELGRDMLSRLIYGGGGLLFVGGFPVCLATPSCG